MQERVDRIRGAAFALADQIAESTRRIIHGVVVAILLTLVGTTADRLTQFDVVPSGLSALVSLLSMACFVLAAIMGAMALLFGGLVLNCWRRIRGLRAELHEIDPTLTLDPLSGPLSGSFSARRPFDDSDQ